MSLTTRDVTLCVNDEHVVDLSSRATRSHALTVNSSQQQRARSSAYMKYAHRSAVHYVPIILSRPEPHHFSHEYFNAMGATSSKK